MQRPRSFLITEAIGDYLKLREQQIAEIQAGMREADSGHLIRNQKFMKQLDY